LIVGLFTFSLALLKQQVMVYPDVTTSHLIGVETPAILLPFLDFFTNILVMLNFHAHVFFQLNITFGSTLGQVIL